MCVRPDLITSSNSAAFASSERASVSIAGSRSLTERSSAARWTADGKTSFDDWPMLTWSFGCTPSPASAVMTSFAFMFELVPEPVWKTSIGNWSSNSPAATRSAAAAIRPAISESSRPRSALARAAAPLIRPSQCATLAGIGSPETGKLATALSVSPPQSFSVAMPRRVDNPRPARASVENYDSIPTAAASSRAIACSPLPVRTVSGPPNGAASVSSSVSPGTIAISAR